MSPTNRDGKVGGAIVLRPDPHAAVVFGRFRDLAGNLLGIYPERHEPSG